MTNLLIATIGLGYITATEPPVDWTKYQVISWPQTAPIAEHIPLPRARPATTTANNVSPDISSDEFTVLKQRALDNLEKLHALATKDRSIDDLMMIGDAFSACRGGTLPIKRIAATDKALKKFN